ncbi:MAG: endonuclease domain-containing protein [Pseudomonadota bacterium]|nr:endonuclease domain-containing protein [Pseudomonadota bacterium]
MARRLRRDETDAERRLWRRLSGRELGRFKFVRQVPIGPYVVDFLCRANRLIVEVDGAQHADNAKDVNRTAFLNQRGYFVLRFWNHEVLCEREAVLDAILAVLDGRLRGTATGLRFAPATPTQPLRDPASPVTREVERRLVSRCAKPNDASLTREHASPASHGTGEAASESGLGPSEGQQ